MNANFGGIAELIEEFLTGKRKSVKYRYVEPDLPVHVLSKENGTLIYTLYWTNICIFEPYKNNYSYYKRRILTLYHSGYRTATTRNAMSMFLDRLYWVKFIPKYCSVFKYATVFEIDNKRFEIEPRLLIYFWGRKSYKRKFGKFTGIAKEIIYGNKKGVLIWLNDFFDKVAVEAVIGRFIGRLPKCFELDKGLDYMIELAPYFVALIALIKKKFLRYFAD